MKTPRSLTLGQLEFFAYVAIAAAFDTLDANLEHDTGNTDHDNDLLIDAACTQLAHTLAILYAQTTGEGMGCADAIGLDFANGKCLDNALRSFGSKKLRDNDATRPDVKFIAHHWTAQAFKGTALTIK